MNLNEDLTPFILYASPQKWKLFQMVSLDDKTSEFAVSNSDFRTFCNKHREKLSVNFTHLFCAPASFIKGSCTMVDQQGRFFDIVSGSYNNSSSILEVGVDSAFTQVFVDEVKLLRKMKQAV